MHPVPQPWAALDDSLPASGQVVRDSSFPPETWQVASSISGWPLSEDH